MFLIDTNVISELRKPPEISNPGVRNWFEHSSSDDLFLSALVIGEIRKGIELRRRTDPQQAVALESWLRRLGRDFGDRVLPITAEIADCWGRAQAVRSFPVIDGLLASTAEVHGLVLVTRNVRDLAGWPAPGLILNPFS